MAYQLRNNLIPTTRIGQPELRVGVGKFLYFLREKVFKDNHIEDSPNAPTPEEQADVFLAKSPCRGCSG